MKIINIIVPMLLWLFGIYFLFVPNIYEFSNQELFGTILIVTVALYFEIKKKDKN